MTIDELDALAATAEVVSTHVDMRVRRSSPFAPEVAAAIDQTDRRTPETRLGARNLRRDVGLKEEVALSNDQLSRAWSSCP